MTIFTHHFFIIKLELLSCNAAEGAEDENSAADARFCLNSTAEERRNSNFEGRMKGGWAARVELSWI